ncbi:helix-turn-helix domain-containing protein [Paenibacillus eucommiae]|uniref:Transcriptional regulator with XRE-family HTH domain n=1 Tax=Paenibacillus eucommiae TaxID=1355755 RepID=A0ABS4IZ45_9BACL|nr:helix-turn-helix transcriptional regulator [Paenibacillus eucommiae]MBP1991814.1 transcriptional regulator with XRE-family HTH domain [Paenibacillus eucommiae]
MSYDYSLIGKRIRKAREDHGITQEKLAEQLDVSNAYISKIERGKTPINLQRLSELCAILEKSTEYILSGTNSSTGDYLRNEIMMMLEGCSAEKIKLISQIIKPIIEFHED